MEEFITYMIHLMPILAPMVVYIMKLNTRLIILETTTTKLKEHDEAIVKLTEACLRMDKSHALLEQMVVQLGRESKVQI